MDELRPAPEVEVTLTAGPTVDVEISQGPTIEVELAEGPTIEVELGDRASPGLPAGGEEGDVLVKRSRANQDAVWTAGDELFDRDYARLNNKPSIEGVTLEGDLTFPELHLRGLTNMELEAMLQL